MELPLSARYDPRCGGKRAGKSQLEGSSVRVEYGVWHRPRTNSNMI